MNKGNYKLIIKGKNNSNIEKKVTISEAIELFQKKQIKLSDLKIKEND